MRIVLALAAVLFATAPSAQSVQDQPIDADASVETLLVSESAPAPAVTVDLSEWVDSPALPPSFDGEIQDAPEQDQEMSGIFYWGAITGTVVSVALFTSMFF